MEGSWTDYFVNYWLGLSTFQQITAGIMLILVVILVLRDILAGRKSTSRKNIIEGHVFDYVGGSSSLRYKGFLRKLAAGECTSFFFTKSGCPPVMVRLFGRENSLLRVIIPNSDRGSGCRLWLVYIYHRDALLAGLDSYIGKHKSNSKQGMHTIFTNIGKGNLVRIVANQGPLHVDLDEAVSFLFND